MTTLSIPFADARHQRLGDAVPGLSPEAWILIACGECLDVDLGGTRFVWFLHSDRESLSPLNSAGLGLRSLVESQGSNYFLRDLVKIERGGFGAMAIQSPKSVSNRAEHCCHPDKVRCVVEHLQLITGTKDREWYEEKQKSPKSELDV